MLAHHPITGEPINILRTKSQLSAEDKTLIWIRSTFKPSTRWSRWFCVVSEPAAIPICGAEALTAILLPPGSVASDWAFVFPTILSGECLVIGTAATIEAFAAAGLETERTLIVEDLYDAYPFMGESVSATDPLSKWVVSLAHVLRMNRIAWSESTKRDMMLFGVGAQIDAWNRTCSYRMDQSLLSLTADADDSVVPAMWLIQQYFVHSSGRRAKEIRNCLERNIACPYIDHILLLNEKPYPELTGKPKIQTVEIGHRLRYNDVFNAIRTHVPAGAYVVFANSDIVFDSTLRHVWRLPMVRRRLFLELLRWEDGESPTIFGPRSDSQDAWILARDCCDFEPTESDFGFPFGKPGCDNAIGVLMMRQRFLVSNPAYSIKTYHVHASAIRNYEPKDVLYKKHFLYVDPTAIQNFAVVSDLRGATYAPPEATGVEWRGKSLGRSFRRPLLCDDADGLATVCTMLKRAEPPYEYSSEGANLWTPAPVAAPLYRLRGGTFMTANGLVSNFREILIGAHVLWAAGWEHANSSTLMASVHVPHLICAPFNKEWSSDLSAWVLHYLPRALAIQQISAGCGVKAEFLVPQTTMIGEFLEDCTWTQGGEERGNITVVPYLNDMNYYSADAWAVPPVEDALVTAEDVDVLRGLLSPAPVPSTEKPVVVFLVEDDVDALCTRGWAESVAENVFHDGWTVRYVGYADAPGLRRKALGDTNWIIGRGPALNWMWLSGAGATVLDFQRIDSPSGEYAHLAGACGLRYILGTVRKEPIIHARQNALLAVARALPTHGFKDVAATKATKSKPKIIMPSGLGLGGIWSHAGDTFREMVDLWAERGYIQVEKSEDTHYCWWGGAGEVLLYDRPTVRWWTAPPPSYQLALFGNCAPPGPATHLLRQSIWSFWGRSPRALEGIALRREGCRDWSSRSIESLFLGKVENGIQLAGRTGLDWSRAVSLFSMPIDSTGKPYPFTQEEYLEKLCNAKFGLCLPGFGPKCNREIEYFCCGVVPIITPGVDMKGYLVPPVEGVHYLTARTPEEVVMRIKETTTEKWASMSAAGRQWWRMYASAEGLYRLTWARIEQCRPYVNSGIPPKFVF